MRSLLLTPLLLENAKSRCGRIGIEQQVQPFVEELSRNASIRCLVSGVVALDLFSGRKMCQHDAVVRFVCLLATGAEAFDELLAQIFVVKHKLMSNKGLAAT